MNKPSKRLLLFLGFFMSPFLFYAQIKPGKVTGEEKRIVLDEIKKLVNDRYIDEQVGSKTVQFLTEKFIAGAYDSLNDVNEFASKLSEDLVFASKDQHFRLLFDPEWVADSKKAVTKKDRDELL